MKIIFPCFLLLLLPMALFADGGVIPSVAFPTSVTIPDQRALICWSNGVERLAIETRFRGEGTNFAWVVPLSGKPVIEEATLGLFATLEHIFRPNVIHNVPPLYALLLAGAGVGYLLCTVRRNTPARPSDTLISLGVALALMPVSACLGIPLLLWLPYSVWRVRSGKEPPWLILVVLLLLFVMNGMLLSAGSGGIKVAVSGVSILSRQTVGAYDTTTITAKEPGPLLEWFRTNGYSILPAAKSVITNYVNRGWVFVATKLARQSAALAEGEPPPLSFTFRTSKVVYPMQLTAVGNSNLSVALFVFGPAQAQAKFFHTERCTVPAFPGLEDYRSHSIGPLNIVHPLLRQWVAGSAVATKLTADLNAPMMTDDVDIQWVPPLEIRRNLYSYVGAGVLGLNYGASVFVAGLLIAATMGIFMRSFRPRLGRMISWAAVVGTFTAAVVFMAVSKIDVRLAQSPDLRSHMRLQELEWLFDQYSRTNRPSSLGEAPCHT